MAIAQDTSVDSGSPIVDLERIVNDGRWGGFQQIILVFAALAFAFDGWTNQVLGVAMPALIHDWGVDRATLAPVAAFGLFGIACGTAVGGFVGDRFGRRFGLIASIGLFSVATLLSAYAFDVKSLAAIRAIAGIGLGGAIPNGAALVTEFTPMRRRSVAIALTMVFIPVGGVLSGLAGTMILPSYGWHALFTVTGAASLVLTIVFVLVLPESPGFLVRQPHRRAKLMQLLARIGYGFSNDTVFRLPDAKSSSPTSALFDQKFKLDTIGLWIGFFFFLLASYSIFNWVPTLLAGQGFNLAQTSLSMTWFNTGGVIGGVLGGFVIGHYGSRWPSLAMAVACVSGAVLMGVIPLKPSQDMLPILAIFTMEGLFVAALSTGLYTIAASAYPPFVRASGIGAAAAFGRLGAVISAFVGIGALNFGGPSFFFLCIAAEVIATLLALLLVRHHVPRAKLIPRRQ